MINPTDEGATPKPSLIMLRTGAMMLPAMMVRVAEVRITPRESLLESNNFAGPPYYLLFGRAEDTLSSELVRIWRVAEGSR
jgi:hypothetical protein